MKVRETRRMCSDDLYRLCVDNEWLYQRDEPRIHEDACNLLGT